MISFLYFNKNRKNPFEKEKNDQLKKKRSPFSRSSSVSNRGRRSFLLKSKETNFVTISKSLKNFEESKQNKYHFTPESNHCAVELQELEYLPCGSGSAINNCRPEQKPKRNRRIFSGFSKSSGKSPQFSREKVKFLIL